MDKQRVFQRKGINIFRVDKILNLEFENYFMDSEYVLDQESGGILTETGKLVIFSIRPQYNRKLPTFVGRWDENKATLDIDIENVDKEIENIFKGGREGYSGHHPKRISNNRRSYKANNKNTQ